MKKILTIEEVNWTVSGKLSLSCRTNEETFTVKIGDLVEIICPDQRIINAEIKSIGHHKIYGFEEKSTTFISFLFDNLSKADVPINSTIQIY